LYYLQSRYYDPETGRFLNADVYCDTGNSVLSTNMFAYCENNAVVYNDLFGYIITNPYIDIGIRGAQTHYKVNNKLNNKNYINNSRYKFNKCIINQSWNPKVRKIKMGLYTGDYNGCGWIAIYNALRLLRCYTIQPKNIMAYLERYGQLLYCTFGVSPWSIANYMSYIGYSVYMETSPKSINTKFKKYRVCILMYLHNKGAHYITITYKNGYYYAYNVFGDSTNFHKWKNVDNELLGRSFKYLYCIYIR